MREEVLRLAGPAYTSRKQPGVYVQGLEAACQLLHRKLQPSSTAAAAQPYSLCSPSHNAPSAALPTSSAAGDTAAAELCTLLLTDQEVLDVVLALHDIRTAQISRHLPSTYDRLPLSVSSGAFARRLSQRQRSASGDQLHLFVAALERDTIVEGDPLLLMWDSMHRAMLLVLAALQSLPFRPHPQHPDPEATTHTPTTPLLPPGYHRCSACLLLSLSLALRLSLRLAMRMDQHCLEQLGGFDQHLARLHAMLPGLLLGLSTAVSVMQAAGHPEADAHRLLLLRCILHLGPQQQCSILEMDWANSKDSVDQLSAEVTTSCPDHLARMLASSPAVTGWPGPLPAKLSSEHSSTAGGSSGMGHTSGSSSSSSRGGVPGKSTGQGGKGPSTARPKGEALMNSLAHVAQALCAVLGRQEEGLIMDQLISTCKAQGHGCLMELRADASCLATAALKVMVREYYCLNYMEGILRAASAPSHPGAVASGHQTTSSSASNSPLFSVVLSVLPRCLVVLQGTVAAVRFATTLDNCFTVKAFPGCFRDSYSSLCMSLRLMVELWPDVRCRPAMLRLLVRTAAAGAHGYSTLALYGAPDYEAETRLVPSLKRTLELKAILTPELKDSLSETMVRVCSGWIRLLVPICDTEQASIDMYNNLYDSRQHGQYVEGSAACSRKEGRILMPSAQQLAPLALDLVWGMEGMLQMMHHHQRLFWRQPTQVVNILQWFTGSRCETLQQLFTGARVLLALFGLTQKVLAEPAAVGPAGLAAQPASWLPCGNSLVEGWCTRLLDRMCQLLCINSPSVPSVPSPLILMVCVELMNMYKHLLDGLHQAPPSMSPEAERLMSCLVLVVTVVVPLDLCVANVQPLPTASEALCCMEGSRDSAVYTLLSGVEAEQVWSWQALAAGTPAEASLASVLQGAANKLQLPHLVATASQGWQPGRLTLDRGRGPPELLKLCFKCFLPLQYLDSLEEELKRIST